MIKTKIEVSISSKLQKALADAAKPIDSDTADLVGESVIDGMRELISGGISPIEGRGKFPAYKNPKKYPGKLKPKSPVNLKVSGDFLDALTHKAVSGEAGKDIQVFYKSDQAIKEEGHADGAHGQPKRPTLPAKGETFAARIRLAYTKIIKERVLKVLKGEG